MYSRIPIMPKQGVVMPDVSQKLGTPDNSALIAFKQSKHAMLELSTTGRLCYIHNAMAKCM